VRRVLLGDPHASIGNGAGKIDGVVPERRVRKAPARLRRLLASPARPTLLVLALLAIPATRATASEPCPNQQLRLEGRLNPTTGLPYSTQLPDCRAYELVSPPDTGAFPVPDDRHVDGPSDRAAQITADGSVFFQSQAVPAGTGAVEEGRYVNVFRSRRASSGWTTGALTAFGGASGNKLLLTASADGSSILIATSLALAPADIDNPANDPTVGIDLYVVRDGAPPEFVSHGEVPNALKGPFGPGGGLRPMFANAELTAVGFVSEVSLQRPQPEGSLTTSTGCYVWVDVGSRLAYLTNPEGAAEPPPLNCNYFAVMPDGRAIIEDTSGDGNTGQIFASAGAASYFGQGTVQLSGSSPGAASFDALSPGGRTAYLTSTDQLDPNSNNEAKPSLYAVSTTSGASAGPPCISCQGESDDTNARYVGQSADGSHVFFSTDQGLWSWEAQTGKATKLTGATDVSQVLSSENGEYVVGLSAQLASNPHGTSDIFEFSAGRSPKLVTSGISADRYELVVVRRRASKSELGEERLGGVSNDGLRVVYDDTPAGGSPTVINEWVSGQVVQISPVGSTHPYQLMGTAGAGLEDVFFESHDALVAQDLNAGTTDIYDARVGGGFPGPGEPANDNLTPNPIGPTTPAYTANLVAPNLQIAPLPPDTSRPAPAAKPSTRARQLAKSLRACKRKRSRIKRLACERAVRRRALGTANRSVHTEERQ
jgi:hypothetical protein